MEARVLSLFDAPTARRSDPQTSHEAAASVAGPALGSLRSDVLAVLESHASGCTCEEVHAEVVRTHPRTKENSVARRLTDLVNAGLAVVSGTRRGSSGRAVSVYQAVRKEAS